MARTETRAAPQATPEPPTGDVLAKLRDELREEAVWRHCLAQDEQRLEQRLRDELMEAVSEVKEAVSESNKRPRPSSTSDAAEAAGD